MNQTQMDLADQRAALRKHTMTRDDVKHVLDRLRIDDTKDDAELVIAYRSNGAFHRILLNELPSGTLAPKRYLTGAGLRAVCEAALSAETL